MAFNYYETHHLLASVQQLPPIHTFLLDRYFPINETTDVFATDDVLVVEIRSPYVWQMDDTLCTLQRGLFP